MSETARPYEEKDFELQLVRSPKEIKLGDDGDWHLTDRHLGEFPPDIQDLSDRPEPPPSEPRVADESSEAESTAAAVADGGAENQVPEQLELPADVADPLQPPQSGEDVLPTDLDEPPVLLKPERVEELLQLGGIDPDRVDDDDWNAILEAMEADKISTPEAAEKWLRDYCVRVQQIVADQQEKSEARAWRESTEARLNAFGQVAEDPAVVQAQRLERIENLFESFLQEQADTRAEAQIQERADQDVAHVLGVVAQVTGRPLDMKVHGEQMIGLLVGGSAPDVVAEVLVGRIKRNAREQPTTTITEGRGRTARTRTTNYGEAPKFVGGSTGASTGSSSADLPADLG